MSFLQGRQSSLSALCFDVAFGLVVVGQRWRCCAASAVRWKAPLSRQRLSHCCNATTPSQAAQQCCCQFVDAVVDVVIVAFAVAVAGVADTVRGQEVGSALLYADDFCFDLCYCVRLYGRHSCREMLIFAIEWKRQLKRWLAWSAGRRRCVEQWAPSWFASPLVAHLKKHKNS